MLFISGVQSLKLVAEDRGGFALRAGFAVQRRGPMLCQLKSSTNIWPQELMKLEIQGPPALV